jgi:hypothetical protein
MEDFDGHGITWLGKVPSAMSGTLALCVKRVLGALARCQQEPDVAICPGF